MKLEKGVIRSNGYGKRDKINIASHEAFLRQYCVVLNVISDFKRDVARNL